MCCISCNEGELTNFNTDSTSALSVSLQLVIQGIVNIQVYPEQPIKQHEPNSALGRTIPSPLLKSHILSLLKKELPNSTHMPHDTLLPGFQSPAMECTRLPLAVLHFRSLWILLQQLLIFNGPSIETHEPSPELEQQLHLQCQNRSWSTMSNGIS